MAELFCELEAAVSWRPAPTDRGARDAILREALLLLSALNQMEASHDTEPAATDQRRLERIEAKLDLALDLLARTLRPDPPNPSQTLRLSPEVAAWADPAPPAEGARLVLEICLVSTLPLTLRLPAIALAAADGEARAQFDTLPEALREALHQFVFRRHRQAIRAHGG